MRARLFGPLSLGMALLAGPGCGGGAEEEGLPYGAWGGSAGMEVATAQERLAVFPPFEGPPILGRASHLRVVGDEILVGESLDARIHRFGLDGEWRGAFGLKGEGPGEFRAISDLQPMGDGTLWVGDWQNLRWIRLDQEGTLQEERPAVSLARSLFPFSDGSFLVPVAGGGSGSGVSVARVTDPGRIPSPPRPPQDARTTSDLASWFASSSFFTSMVVAGGDAWLLQRDTVYRVPGVEEAGTAGPGSRLPESTLHPATPVFALPEAWGDERRAQAARNFGGRAFVWLVTGIGVWENRGVVVKTGNPAGTLGYLLEPDASRGEGIRVIRLTGEVGDNFLTRARDLQLRGDTLFAISATEVRSYRVAFP